MRELESARGKIAGVRASARALVWAIMRLAGLLNSRILLSCQSANLVNPALSRIRRSFPLHRTDARRALQRFVRMFTQSVGAQF